MVAIKRILVMTLLLLTFAGTLSSAEGREEDGWELTIAPYAWMPSIDGDLTIGGQTADIDVGFDDLLDNTDFAAMLQIELRKGRFGLFAQPNYFKITAEDDRPLTDVEIETEAWIVEFGAFFRLGQGGGERPAIFDLLIGGRHWSLSNEIDVEAPVIGVTVDRERDSDLIDPFVGLRLGSYLTNRLQFRIRGDVGGFDLSENMSEFSWQAIGFLAYDFTDVFSIEAGYRALAIDLEDEDAPANNALDLVFQGPVAGLSIRF